MYKKALGLLLPCPVLEQIKRLLDIRENFKICML